MSRGSPRFAVRTGSIPKELSRLGFVAWVDDAQHPDGTEGGASCAFCQDMRDAERIAAMLNRNLSAVKVEEGDRQLVLLSLGLCALLRPGFNEALSKIATQFSGLEMFESFKELNSDQVRAVMEKQL